MMHVNLLATSARYETKFGQHAQIVVETHQSHRPRGLLARFGVFETFGRREKKCGRPKNDQRIGRYRETHAERASRAIDSKTNFKNKSKFRSVMSNKKLALSIIPSVAL